MAQVAKSERVAPEFIRQGVAAGTIVIPHNIRHRNGASIGIGSGLRTKVSASVGVYADTDSIDTEVAKIKAALEAGTDSIMDLSVKGDIDAMRRENLAAASTPLGTLPYYQAVSEAAQKYGTALKMDVEALFDVIERQAADGVDFLALHCGTTMSIVERLKKENRLDPLVSYGGSHLIGWMLHNHRENPLYEYYDRVLEIARISDVTLSIADGVLPGRLPGRRPGARAGGDGRIGTESQRSRRSSNGQRPGPCPPEPVKGYHCSTEEPV